MDIVKQDKDYKTLLKMQRAKAEEQKKTEQEKSLNEKNRAVVLRE